MLGSDILEVAISMAFLFLFMSTIASALREAFEAKMQHRAADLERGISELLQSGQGEDWVKEFYNHPLICSLYKGQYDPNGKLMPAYIPKESFSLALLDLVAGASQAGKLLSMQDLSNKLTAPGTSPNAVQRIVLTALAAGNKDLDEVRKRLEDLYDGTMDRVTSWYAKRTGKFLFAIGLASAVLLNVDSITIVKRLSIDRPLRQAIVAEAEHSALRNAENAPAAAAPAPAPAPAGGGAAAPAAPADTAAGGQKKSFEELRSEFKELGFPTGWTWSGNWPYPAPQACTPDGAGGYKCPSDWSSYGAALIVALLGWLVTAVAIMLGAPFWFDLLNKLISLRSSLKPPEDKSGRKKAAKAPKPPQQPQASQTLQT